MDATDKATRFVALGVEYLDGQRDTDIRRVDARRG